jgi:putative FmdB family regulatory protein
MPLFEYVCEKCDERFEVIKRTLDEDEVRCPSCDEPARKLLSRFAVKSGASSGATLSPPTGSCGPWGGG